jgi:hypothetical protein
MPTEPMKTGPDLIDRLHSYRQEISKLIQPIRAEVSLRHEKGGDEITLAWRSLQQAKMWLGMALGENQINPPWEKDGDN